MSSPMKSVVLAQSQHTLSVKDQVLCEALQATGVCHSLSLSSACATWKPRVWPALEAKGCASIKIHGIFFSLLLICF